MEEKTGHSTNGSFVFSQSSVRNTCSQTHVHKPVVRGLPNCCTMNGMVRLIPRLPNQNEEFHHKEAPEQGRDKYMDTNIRKQWVTIDEGIRRRMYACSLCETLASAFLTCPYFSTVITKLARADGGRGIFQRACHFAYQAAICSC